MPATARATKAKPSKDSPTVNEVLEELRSLGSDQTKKTFMRHGAREPLFGVKVGDLKKIEKRVKVNHQLALDLFATGNYDAMYLAGLIADDARMTRDDLQRWVKGAYCYAISGFTVPWVACGSPAGHAIALEWIDSKDEQVAIAGWSTLAGRVAITPDDQLDLAELKKLLARVRKSIHAEAPNRVAYAMNSFVISVGGYVAPLTKLAIETAEAIGEVEVDMGDTSCKVPSAADYIRKMEARGAIGKKRKTIKC